MRLSSLAPGPPEDGAVLLVTMYIKAERDDVKVTKSGGQPGMNKRELEKIVKAIEAEAGETLPELREAADRKGRFTTPEQALVCAVRVSLGLSQIDFAARIGTPVATLRDWEQGRFAPPGAALCLLRHPHTASATLIPSTPAERMPPA